MHKKSLVTLALVSALTLSAFNFSQAVLSSPANIILRFPTSNIGDVLRINGGVPYRYQTTLLQPAQGSIAVQPGIKLLLSLNPSVKENLDALDKVDPAPIYGMTFLYTPFTDKDIDHILRFKNLRFVDLSDSDVSDVGAAKLANLPNLECLILRHVNINGSCLSKLAGLKNLKYLYLGWNDLKAGELAAVKKMPALEELQLTKTHLRDADMVSLQGAINIQRLVLLEEHLLTDKSIPIIKSLKNLNSLDIRQTGITASGLVQLKSLDLKSLKLESRSYSDKDKATIKTAFPKTHIYYTNKMKKKLQIFEEVTGEQLEGLDK